MAQSFSIVNGPGKFALMESCFSGKEISFDIRIGNGPKETIRVRWIGVQAEDGSGESWSLSFRCKEFGKVRGYYRTKGRAHDGSFGYMEKANFS